MTSFRIGPWLLALVLCLWVASVQASEVSYASDASDASGEPLEAMTRSEPVETEVETRVVETALSWSDLTRLAREHQKRGELDEAKIDMLVEVLAEACGYCSRERFNAAFRRETGKTPSAYRKEYRFGKN